MSKLRGIDVAKCIRTPSLSETGWHVHARDRCPATLAARASPSIAANTDVRAMPQDLRRQSLCAPRLQTHTAAFTGARRAKRSDRSYEASGTTVNTIKPITTNATLGTSSGRPRCMGALSNLRQACSGYPGALESVLPHDRARRGPRTWKASLNNRIYLGVRGTGRALRKRK